MEAVGLNRTKTKAYAGKLAIFDGRSCFLRFTSWSLVNFIRLIHRYGLSIVRTNALVEKTVHKFSVIYDLQASGLSFDSPEQLLRSLRLYNLTQYSLDQVLARAHTHTHTHKHWHTHTHLLHTHTLTYAHAHTQTIAHTCLT